ncbi:MAG: hypothetical protein ACXABJ_03740 [Candidatus Heimdallarchaeaceae archaeon]|jgi:tetratricopeptide (TPR) repeat protein
MRFDELKNLDISSIEDTNLFRIYVNYLLAVSRTKKPKEALELIESAIKRSRELKDNRSLAVIYYIKNILIFGFEDTIAEVNDLSGKVKKISKEIGFKEGGALAAIMKWGTYKLGGNYEEAKQAREKAMQIMDSIRNPEPIYYYWVKYSFAIGEWTEDQNPSAAEMIKECRDFFRRKSFYMSEIKATTLLSRIYFKLGMDYELQNLVQELMVDEDLFDYYPKTSLARYNLLLGQIALNSSDKTMAEMYFFTSTQLFRKFGNEGEFVYDYLSGLSYLSRIYATEGKIRDVYTILEELKKVLSNLKLTIPRRFINTLIGSFTLSYFYVSSHKGHEALTEQESIQNRTKSAKQLILHPEVLNQLMVYSGFKIDEMKKTKEQDNKDSYLFFKKVVDFLLELENPKTVNFNARIKNAIRILSIEEESVVLTSFEKTFSELIIARLYLSMGKNTEFKKIMKNYLGKESQYENVTLNVWIKLLNTIFVFLQDDNREKALTKIEKISWFCLDNKLSRLHKESLTLYNLFLKKNYESYSKHMFENLMFHDIFASSGDFRVEMIQQINVEA